MGIKYSKGYQGRGLCIATSEGYALIGGAIPSEIRRRWWTYPNLERSAESSVMASNNRLIDAWDKLCGPIVRDAIL